MSDYDVVIIGGGMAGLTAGLFAARYGHSTLVLEPSVPGGQLLNIEKVEDFPGFPQGISGFEIGPSVQEQAENAGAEFRPAEVTCLEADGDGWAVVTDDGRIAAKAVIIASGAHPRPLGVPGEHEYTGKGVSHCASCDGPIFMGKRVGVVGGGDFALQEALVLAGFASEVVVFCEGTAFTAAHVYKKAAAENRKISARFGTAVTEVVGDRFMTGVRVRDVATGQESAVELSAIFVYIAVEPNTAFAKNALPLDPDGRIPTDIWMRTERAGVFAAGEVRRDAPGRAITACGDGTTAAIAAHRYIEQRFGS